MTLPKHKFEWIHALAAYDPIPGGLKHILTIVALKNADPEHFTVKVHHKTVAANCATNPRSVGRAFAAADEHGWFTRLATGKRSKGYHGADEWVLNIPDRQDNLSGLSSDRPDNLSDKTGQSVRLERTNCPTRPDNLSTNGPPDLREHAPYGFNNGFNNGLESGTAAASDDRHALEVDICEEEQEQPDTEPHRLPAVQAHLEILDAELVGPRAPVDIDDEPPLGCPDHPDNAIPKCGPCMRARQKRERWVAGGGLQRQLLRETEMLGTLSGQRTTAAQTGRRYRCGTCCDTGYVHRSGTLGDLPAVLALCLICGLHPDNLNPRGHRYVITADDMPDHRDAIDQLKAQYKSRELTA